MPVRGTSLHLQLQFGGVYKYFDSKETSWTEQSILMYEIYKLDWVAPLATDPPRANSTHQQSAILHRGNFRTELGCPKDR